MFIEINKPYMNPIEATVLQQLIPTVGNPAGLPLEVLAEYGYAPVTIVNDPPIDPNVEYLVRPTQATLKGGEWVIESTVVQYTSQELQNIEDTLRTSIIEQIKDEAFRRIVLLIPVWKQRNLTARAAVFAMKTASGTTLTPSEQVEWDAGLAQWTQIDEIRTKSGTIETLVTELSLVDLKGFDPSLEQYWV